jgi:hypothetical protein
MAITVNGTVELMGTQVLSRQEPHIPDVSDEHDPSHHVISELAFSAIPTQAEVQALQAEVLRLRDFVADITLTVNTLLGSLRTHGLIAPGVGEGGEDGGDGEEEDEEAAGVLST